MMLKLISSPQSKNVKLITSIFIDSFLLKLSLLQLILFESNYTFIKLLTYIQIETVPVDVMALSISLWLLVYVTFWRRLKT